MIVTRTEACNLITDMLNNDINLEGKDLEKVIFAVNEDLQVRDWLTGMPITWPIEDCIKFVQYMAFNSTSDDSVPFTTVQSQFHYEMGEKEHAKKLLEYSLTVNPAYPLALLMTRVVEADWPTDAFISMREKIHPRVVESCYGEEGNTPLPLEV